MLLAASLGVIPGIKGISAIKSEITPNLKETTKIAMELLFPGRFDHPGESYACQKIILEEVAADVRPPTVSITPSVRHVGVTRRDTLRPGFKEAVRAANEEGYPVLVRSAGGGATAAGPGTFGFSIIRPSRDLEDSRRGIGERYDEAAALVLGAFTRLGVEDAEVGEVRNEFCPGDHSIRIGGFEYGMKLVGIAQRVTKRATSVGGIVLVWGEEDLRKVLRRIYSALELPLRSESVGSLHRAGTEAGVGDAIRALAEEAKLQYDVASVPLDERTLRRARSDRGKYIV